MIDPGGTFPTASGYVVRVLTMRQKKQLIANVKKISEAQTNGMTPEGLFDVLIDSANTCLVNIDAEDLTEEQAMNAILETLKGNAPSETDQKKSESQP